LLLISVLFVTERVGGDVCVEAITTSCRHPTFQHVYIIHMM